MFDKDEMKRLRKWIEDIEIIGCREVFERYLMRARLLDNLQVPDDFDHNMGDTEKAFARGVVYSITHFLTSYFCKTAKQVSYIKVLINAYYEKFKGYDYDLYAHVTSQYKDEDIYEAIKAYLNYSLDRVEVGSFKTCLIVDKERKYVRCETLEEYEYRQKCISDKENDKAIKK